jgi:AAA+ superfamily predicted ATPase
VNQQSPKDTNVKTQICNYIRAGYAGLYLVSCEEARVEAEVQAIARSLQYALHAWSITDGLVEICSGSVRPVHDPLQVMAAIAELPENSVVLLRDFHVFMEEPDPAISRAIKDLLHVGKTKAKVIAILGCRFVLPPELQREFVAVEFALPCKAELAVVLDHIAVAARHPVPEGDARELLLDAARGLTCIEAENAFALSLVEQGALTPVVIAREKAHELKKNGLLEVIPLTTTLDEIGGLDLLKAWLLQRKDAFGQNARAYGLPMPKGLLIVGVPGTGKSLAAKATASVFQRPLLRLDAGRLFASLVGQSESNLRSVIATAEAIAPCVLWIDEIEKGFSGTKSSNSADGGTASRVFGSFLSWMQEKTAPVFVVATANDVTQLPAELLRKGRFDELFFVDLPRQEERERIWTIQVEKYGRDGKDFDCTQLAKATDGFTGSEIEQAFIDALYRAFTEGNEPSDLVIAQVLTEVTPLSKLMAENISALKQWAKGRTRPASSRAAESNLRRLTS